MVEIDKLNLEFKWKCEGTRAAKTIMKESKNEGRFHTLILRHIYQDNVVLEYKDRSIEHNREFQMYLHM